MCFAFNLSLLLAKKCFYLVHCKHRLIFVFFVFIYLTFKLLSLFFLASFRLMLHVLTGLIFLISMHSFSNQ